MKIGITWESVIEKLGFDPRLPMPIQKSKDDWLIDDSKPNPFSVLSEEENQFLEDNWFGPQARQARSA